MEDFVLNRNSGFLVQAATKYCPLQQAGDYVRVSVMVFNATVNNISVISWRSALLMEETGIPEENHRPVRSY
jgi:hypothetical protein